MIKILFVCLGNICRSPLAEGVLNHLTTKHGLSDNIYVDSAGLIDYSLGKPADERMREVAQKNGIELYSTARLLTKSDLSVFDHILVADSTIMRDVKKLAKGMNIEHKISYIREYDTNTSENEIPDPYSGTMDDFEDCFEIVHKSVNGLFEKLKKDIR